MQVNTTKFMLRYAWYSWPNVVLCFFGGFLIDQPFGIRWGTIIFSCYLFLLWVEYLMLFGRWTLDGYVWDGWGVLSSCPEYVCCELV